MLFALDCKNNEYINNNGSLIIVIKYISDNLTFPD